MNAYELADYLEKQYFHSQSVSDAISTLRYQADRIAELEKDLEGCEYFLNKTKPLSDEEIWNWFKENTALTKESALRISRAIEERHGIK